jgi:hypothetical protein
MLSSIELVRVRVREYLVEVGDGVMRTGLVWLRIGRGGELL